MADLLLRRRIPELSRKLNLTKEEVQEPSSTSPNSTPTPAASSAPTQRPFHRTPPLNGADGVGYHGQQRLHSCLRINPAIKQLIAKGQLNKKEKEFIKEQMNSGKFLMSSIEQRQQTIERISREILNFRKLSSRRGSVASNPLLQNQVSEILEVHETTVSLAIANKYLETPTVPSLSNISSPPLRKGSRRGRCLQPECQRQIQNHRRGEPRQTPSDQAIANMLSKEDIKKPSHRGQVRKKSASSPPTSGGNTTKPKREGDKGWSATHIPLDTSTIDNSLRL